MKKTFSLVIFLAISYLMLALLKNMSEIENEQVSSNHLKWRIVNFFLLNSVLCSRSSNITEIWNINIVPNLCLITWDMTRLRRKKYMYHILMEHKLTYENVSVNSHVVRGGSSRLIRLKAAGFTSWYPQHDYDCLRDKMCHLIGLTLNFPNRRIYYLRHCRKLDLQRNLSLSYHPITG